MRSHARFCAPPIGKRTEACNYLDESDPNAPSGWLFSISNYSTNTLNQYRMVKTGVPSGGQGLNYDDDGNLIEAYVASDLNDDGQVTIADLNLLLAAIGTSTCTNPAPIQAKYFYRADVNDDCVISLDDLVALLGNFGLKSAHSMHATYLWDAENRLVEVIPSSPTPSAKRVKFGYDYMSRPVEKLVYSRNAGNTAWQSVPSDQRQLRGDQHFPLQHQVGRRRNELLLFRLSLLLGDDGKVD